MSNFVLPSGVVEFHNYLDSSQGVTDDGDHTAGGSDVTPDWYDAVEDYGATGDGVTDDSTAIQNAINAAEADSGGVVYFPQGTYQIGSSLVIDSSGVTLMGDGAKSVSVLRATAGLASGDIIQVSADHTNIRDLYLTSSSQKTGGSGIAFTAASYCNVERIRMENQYHSIKITNGVVVRIKDADLHNQAQNAIWITGSGTGNDYLISGVVADNSPASSGSGILIDRTAEGATWVFNSDFLHFANGLKIVPASGTTRWHFFTGVAIDQSTNDGIVLGGGGGSVHGVTFTNCWSSSNGGDGLSYGSGVSGVNFVGGKVLDNDEHGFNIVDGEHYVVSDSLIASNSDGTTTSFDGIFVAAGVEHLTITGNQAFNFSGLGTTQRYGLNFASGATNYIQIVGNDFQNNVTGEINNLSGVTGTHITFLPVLSGTATQYLDGTGAWSTPSGGGVGGAIRRRRDTSAQTLSPATSTNVDFNGLVREDDPDGDITWNATTDAFDINTTGWYQIEAGVGFSSPSPDTYTRLIVDIKAGGTIVNRDEERPGLEASGGFISSGTFVYITSGQAVEIEAFQENSGASNTTILSNAATYCSIVRLA